MVRVMSSDIEARAAASSRKIEEILATIEDDGLRDDVSKVVRLAFDALAKLRRVHLPQDHFEEGDTVRSDDDKHIDLAPYVLAALSSTNQLLGYVAKRFPAPAGLDAPSDDNFDLEFDLVDGPTGEGVGLSHRTQSRAAMSEREQVADALNAFAGMLRLRVSDFANRLKFAVAQQDSWPLLAELDDAQHGLSKAVQAVLFGVLGVFVSDVRREEILPAYRSAVTESVQLRAAVADLSYHINRFNQALADATPEIAVPLVVAVSDRLARFSARPAYRTLRAEDKKAIIDFRATLHSLRHRREGLPMLPLRHAVEGFSKFLEAMSAINHREVLVLHDRQRLQEVLTTLDSLLAAQALPPSEAAAKLELLMDQLVVVTGRSPELDDMMRTYGGRRPVAENAAGDLKKLKDHVEMALAAL
jgi:hypothetical protein